MIKKNHDQKTSTILVLLIFCVFAVSVLIVLVLGASIYKNMDDLSKEGYHEQITLSYIWSKVKSGDEAGKIYIDDHFESPVLCIDEEHDGVSYRTMIYLYDGWIRELFSETDLHLSLESGTPIIEAQSFSLEQLENGLIKATAGSESLLIFPRSKVGLPVNPTER